MKLKDVRTAIYDRLGDPLSQHSFKLKKGREAFVRAVPEGRQSIYVSIVDLEPNFEFSVVVGLRADPVEQIAHLFSGASEKYQELSETAIVQLSHFMNGGKSDFIVSSIQDIDSATATISTTFREKILAVMDECKDISALEARVNSPRRNFNSAQPPYSLLTSLALASLANPDAFESLAKEATASISQHPASDREKVAGLISHLRKQWMACEPERSGT